METKYSNDLQTTEHEQLLKKHCNRNFQIRIGITAAAINAFTGLVCGYLSSTSRKISNNELTFPSEKNDASKIVNIATLGTFLGPIIFTYCINHLGRKKTMILLLFPTLLQFIIILFAESMTLLITAITIGYMGHLVAPVIIGIYIAEMTSPHLRGSMNAFLFIFYATGAVLGLTINWIMPLQQSSLVLGILVIVYASFALTLPETPYFFIRNNRRMDARKVIEKLYSKDFANLELSRLEAHINEEKLHKLREIFSSKKNLKILGKMQIVYCLKYFSGILVMFWYSPILLSTGKYVYLSALSCELLTYLASIIVGLCTLFIFRYVSRKKMGLISMFGIITFLIFLILYSYLIETGDISTSSFPDIFPFVLILFFKCSAVLGVTPLAYGYLRELCPVKLIAYYSLIMDFSAPIQSAISFIMFNYLRTTFNDSVGFGFFLVCALIWSVLFYIFVPETHNKTLENIQDSI